MYAGGAPSCRMIPMIHDPFHLRFRRRFSGLHLPLLEFSVDGLPHTSANSVPFRGTIGPISDQSRTNLGQLHLARTHVATIKPPPADLPPACPSMLTVRPTPLPQIHCTSWIMGTLYLFSSGVLLWGSAVRVRGHCHAGSPPRPRRCDLGDATSEKRPRRSDLGDATSCAPPLLRGTRPASCSHMQTMPPPKTCAPPEDPVPSSGTTAPRSRSDFRCNLANEIQSRLATSHRSAGGRRAHLPY